MQNWAIFMRVLLACTVPIFISLISLRVQAQPSPQTGNSSPGQDLVQNGQELTIEKVRQKYQGVKNLKADIEQTRTGKHLLKPFVSEIRLDYSPGNILWQYIKPFEKSIRMTKAGLEMGDARLPPGHSKRLELVTQMLDSLFRMDVEALRKDFQLTTQGQTLTAIPKPDSPLKFVKNLAFEFSPNLDILAVSLVTESDTATLAFRNVRMEK
jgi:outer membrane lipoprotein-sorting protein